MAVLVAVAQEVRARAVSITALKLAEPAVASWAGWGLIWAVSAVPLTVTFPPDRNTSIEVEERQKCSAQICYLYWPHCYEMWEHLNKEGFCKEQKTKMDLIKQQGALFSTAKQLKLQIMNGASEHDLNTVSRILPLRWMKKNKTNKGNTRIKEANIFGGDRKVILEETGSRLFEFDNRKFLTNRSLLAHLYWVLVHMRMHWVTPLNWTVRKWSGHTQVRSRPPLRIRHRCEQPPLFRAQGLFTVRGRATNQMV